MIPFRIINSIFKLGNNLQNAAKHIKYSTRQTSNWNGVLFEIIEG